MTTALLVAMYVGGPVQFNIFIILQNQLPRHMRQLSVLVTLKFPWWLDCSFVLLCFLESVAVTAFFIPHSGTASWLQSQ